MTNSMENLLKDFHENIWHINKLISLGVIDRNKFINSVIETKDSSLIHNVAREIKGILVEPLVDALVDLFSSNDQENSRWDYLSVIVEEVKNSPIDKIVDILIQKSVVDEKAAIELARLLCTKYDQDKLIDAIIDSKSFYAMLIAQEKLNYKSDTIISKLLEMNEQDNMLFWNLFYNIANCDLKYIPDLVIHMKEVFPQKYLFALLHSNIIFKIEKSLDEELIMNNSKYLNILYNLLKSVLNKLETNPYRCYYVKITSEYRDYLFSPECFSKEELNKILDCCKKILNKIETNSAFIASLDETNRFNHLMNLCRRGDSQTILSNLEHFRSLFQSSLDDTSLQKGDSKTKKLMP